MATSTIGIIEEIECLGKMHWWVLESQTYQREWGKITSRSRPIKLKDPQPTMKGAKRILKSSLVSSWGDVMLPLNSRLLLARTPILAKIKSDLRHHLAALISLEHMHHARKRQKKLRGQEHPPVGPLANHQPMRINSRHHNPNLDPLWTQDQCLSPEWSPLGLGLGLACQLGSPQLHPLLAPRCFHNIINKPKMGVRSLAGLTIIQHNKQCSNLWLKGCPSDQSKCLRRIIT